MASKVLHSPFLADHHSGSSCHSLVMNKIWYKDATLEDRVWTNEQGAMRFHGNLDTLYIALVKVQDWHSLEAQYLHAWCLPFCHQSALYIATLVPSPQLRLSVIDCTERIYFIAAIAPDALATFQGCHGHEASYFLAWCLPFSWGAYWHTWSICAWHGPLSYSEVSSCICLPLIAHVPGPLWHRSTSCPCGIVCSWLLS